MTLALLITAVGGAWADETPLLTIESKDYQSFKSGSMTFDDKVTVTFSGEVFNDGDEEGWYAGSASLLTVAGTNGYTITSCKFYTGYGIAVTGYTVEGESPSVYLYAAEVYTDNSKSVSLGSNGVTKIEVYGGVADPNAVEVTTNAASKQDLFTEASFKMPPFDATVNYMLVRDMSIQMTATMGDGTDGVRYRVKKAQQGEGYEPADMDMTQVLALVDVYDGIEQESLTLNQDYYCRIYKLDEQTLQPEGDGVELTDFDFAPGLYALKAFANVGSNYDGETALSNTFQLFQGYEITVPAGEFVTYYKDEALGLGVEHYTAGAALYTITDVNGTTATATELEITTDEPPLAQVAPAYTPLLVYNGSDEDMRVLLIPTTSSATVSHFSGFTGSLESQTLWGGEGFYACNGKQFVYVKNDLTLPANKCCLKITSGNSFEQGSRSITIVFDETTKIANTNLTNLTNGNWYDLNGRKLNGMPTKKGVYIMNGRKVVVK